MDTYVMSARRSRFFDQTVPFIKPTFAFLTTPKPVRIGSLRKLFGAFTLRIWIMIGICLCMLSLGERVVKLLHTKWKDKRLRINVSSVLHALTVDNEHANTLRPSSITQTLFIVLYTITVTTFTAAYHGALLQTILVDDAHIYSVDELIHQITTGERQLIVESFGYYFTDEIDYMRELNDSSDMSMFARLARATENNPIIENENGTEVLDGVAKNKYILMHMTHWIEDMLKLANYRTYDQCNVFDLIHVDDGSDHWLGAVIGIDFDYLF